MRCGSSSASSSSGASSGCSLLTLPWPVLLQVVAIGIGGSFLGPLFVHTALKTAPDTMAAAKGRELRFLANVDPIDVARWGGRRAVATAAGAWIALCHH